MACVAVGAGRGTGAAMDAARVESAQHAGGAGSAVGAVDAVGADCVGYAGHAGCVGCVAHRAVGGAVRGVSRGQGGLGQDGTAAPGHCWLSGCLGGCWVGCLTGCSDC